MADDTDTKKPPESGRTSAPQPDPKAETEHDVVLLHGRTEDGSGLRALRARPGRLDLAEIRPVREGAPIHGGDLVRLLPRPGSPLVWNVDVQYRAGEGEPGGGHEGPARVVSDRYRENWDTIFGGEGPKPATGAEAEHGTGREERPGSDETYRRNWELVFGGGQGEAGDEAQDELERLVSPRGRTTN